LTKDIAVFNVDGKFYALSNVCAHKGGPLNEGMFEKYLVTCPWHGWKYDVRTGNPPHEGGDSVDCYNVTVIGYKLYADFRPAKIGTKSYSPHRSYADLQNNVKNHLRHLDTEYSVTSDIIVRILGISSTNSNDDVAP